MLGFPGETEADFDELMHFMAEHPFDRVGAFTYSAEDGTPAASMPNAVDAETAEQRLDRLMRQQMKISLELNRARIGTVVEALVDGADEEFLFCRSYAEAADVDGIIKGSALRKPRSRRKLCQHQNHRRGLLRPLR